MNLINGKGSMSTATSAPARKSADMVSDQFPAGLRVLVVDDDPTCLMILEKMLRTCLYEVTKCNRAEMALQLLRQNKNGFDIVLSDVHMPDMDGFQLLVDIGLEMDLPVIMMSADDSKHVVMKGVTHGACDYLIKPVRIEALKNIWQHVIRKKKNDVKDMEQSGSADEGDQPLKPSEDADYSSSANEGNWRNAKKRKDEDEEAEDRDDTSSLKKPRVVWSVELHQQFVGAVEQLGIDKAVPKKILELMNVPGLTRENVASHLQKYRLYLRRLHGNPHHGALSNSFITQQEATFAPMSSLNGLDLHALAATGQLPAQSLSTLQTSGLRSTAKPSIPMALEQRNSFSFDNPKLSFADVQQQSITSGKPMNLLHGIPTNMEPKQLANLHQSAQSLGNMSTRVSAPGGQSNTLLMQMAQQQPRRKMVNESTGNQIPRLPSSVGQAIMANGLSSGMLGRNDTPNDRTAPSSYTPVPQNSSTLNYPMNHPTEMQVHNLPLGNMQGMSNSQKKVSFPREFNPSMKGPQGYIPSYNIFNELNLQKPNDWELQNAGLNFHASQRGNPSSQDNLDISPSVLVQHGFSSRLQNGQNIGIGKSMLSHTEGMQQIQHISQSFIPLVENPARAKAERVADATHASVQNSFFPEQFGQDDLMSALLKQEGIGSADNDFDFDGYSLDNIPV